MTYSDRVGWQGREVTPPPSVRAGSRADDTGGRRPEGSTSGPGALQQRKHFASVLPAAEGYLPKHGPATQRAASQAEGTERPQALTELENRLSCWQRRPAAAPAAGTAGNSPSGTAGPRGCLPAPPPAELPLPVVHAGWTHMDGSILTKRWCWAEPGED